jgi:hypothetical protein
VGPTIYAMRHRFVPMELARLCDSGVAAWKRFGKLFVRSTPHLANTYSRSVGDISVTVSYFSHGTMHVLDCIQEAG